MQIDKDTKLVYEITEHQRQVVLEMIKKSNIKGEDSYFVAELLDIFSQIRANKLHIESKKKK